MNCDVTVRWHALSQDHPGWYARRCLYAYLAPGRRAEILYIGKSWEATVRGRWVRAAKEKFWDDLESNRRIRKHAPLYGEVRVNYAGRLSSELLSDVESLLIAAEQPWGNIQCRTDRISRPGLTVKCTGEWPGRARVYADTWFA